jgi:hypothetical protein
MLSDIVSLSFSAEKHVPKERQECEKQWEKKLKKNNK